MKSANSTRKITVTYCNGWFLAKFNDFRSSKLIDCIEATRFELFDSSRFSVSWWKITNCPHFVISTSSRMLLHLLSMHWCRIKTEKDKRKMPSNNYKNWLSYDTFCWTSTCSSNYRAHNHLETSSPISTVELPFRSLISNFLDRLNMRLDSL